MSALDFDGMPVDVVRHVANLTGHVGPEVGRFPCSFPRSGGKRPLDRFIGDTKVVTWSHEFLDQWAAGFRFCRWD